MRTIIAAVVIGLLAGGGVYGEERGRNSSLQAIDRVQFATVIKESRAESFIPASPDTLIPSSITFEVGDSLPWICFVEPGEGGQWIKAESNKGYSLLKIDKNSVVVRTDAISFVSADDEVKAAMAYRKILDEFRKTEAQADRPVLTHRAAVDPRVEAYIQRRDQAIERGASDGEIEAIEANEQMRQMLDELRRIRTQQVIFSGQRVIQY